MPQVTIHPGGTVEQTPEGTDIWTFRATVDGRAGIVSIEQPLGTPETEAAEGAKSLLEEEPSQLGGIV